MIEYNIINGGRTVVATITGCEDDVARKLRKVMGEEAMHGKLYNASKLRNEFSAKATCHPDDTFDLEEGKKIARKRLLDKYDESYIKALNRVDDVIDVHAGAIMMQIQRVLNKCKKGKKQA